MSSPRIGSEEPKTPTRRIVDELVQARLDLGFDHGAVARRLNVVPNTVRAWEQGRNCPSYDTLVRWAYVLGYKLDYHLAPRAA